MLLITERQYSTETFNIAPARLDGAINESVRFYPAKATEALTGWRVDYSECDTEAVMTDSYNFVNASGTLFSDPADIVRNTAGYFTLKNSNNVD
jgi:hypothetical protein